MMVVLVFADSVLCYLFCETNFMLLLAQRMEIIMCSNSGVLLYLGVSGMFGGFSWLAFGRVFGLGTRFGVYEILTAVCKGMFFLIFF